MGLASVSTGQEIFNVLAAIMADHRSKEDGGGGAVPAASGATGGDSEATESLETGRAPGMPSRTTTQPRGTLPSLQ